MKSNTQRYILSAEIALTNFLPVFNFNFNDDTCPNPLGRHLDKEVLPGSCQKLSPEVDRTGADMILISVTK